MSEGHFDIRQASRLDSAGRIAELKPRELLMNVAKVTKGMVCIDFGSGTGTFALPMAILAGDGGKVYAVDNSAEMLEHIRAKKPPPNLILLKRNVERTELDSHIGDLCLLAFILHEVKQPYRLIAEASRLLKSEGRLVVVEWKADLEAPGPPRKRRIPREQIEQLFEQAGLDLAEYIDWSQNHYVTIGKKREAA